MGSYTGPWADQSVRFFYTSSFIVSVARALLGGSVLNIMYFNDLCGVYFLGIGIAFYVCQWLQLQCVEVSRHDF